MATLDELLALLPDNDTGEIDAVDLRTIVTALWDRAGTTVGGTWKYSPDTDGTPQTTFFQFDTTLPVDATRIDFNVHDVSGSNLRTLLLNAHRFVIQQATNPDNWAAYVVTEQAVVSGDGEVVSMNITRTAGEGAGISAAWQDILVYFTLGPVT